MKPCSIIFRRIATPAAGDLAVGPPQHGDDQADSTVEHGLLIPALRALVDKAHPGPRRIS
eukprot:748430-Hanusia_phi.AAC.2